MSGEALPYAKSTRILSHGSTLIRTLKYLCVVISGNKIVVFFGRPGAGKGTRSTRLAATLKIPCLSIGRLLREASKLATLTGKRIRENLLTGQLMETELLDEMLRNRTEEPDCATGYIVDGYPRNLTQANWLEDW